MAYIGNSPGVASQRITTTFTATAGQTTFTPQSGYTVGYIDVFVNGVKLINGDDFTASNGTTVVLIAAASADDVVETVAFLPRGLSDGYTKAEADARYMSASATTLPSQTSNAGKFLTTDGTNASWATVTMPDEIRDPVNSSPANGSGGQLETPTLTSSAFRSLYGETHSKSQWQVSTASDFSTTVVSTGDSNSLTSYTISSGVLSPATTYYWRVRYKDSNGTYSDWSTATTFITVSSFTYSIEYLVVAGGGGGGSDAGGGGGAGGLLTGSFAIAPSASMSVNVGLGGAGGTGGADPSDPANRAGNGTNSTLSATGFTTQTAIGGGYGGMGQYQLRGGGTGSGGSGGGGGGTYPDVNAGGPAGSGTAGQGNNGAAGLPSQECGGGGGGRGAAATNQNGGAGYQWLNGSFYSGGGGGGGWSGGVYNDGAGGAGGGGNGGGYPGNGAGVGSAGSANTGGGGGGGNQANGAAGGSGVVIIRYSGSQKGTGGTVTSSGGYTYHTFTSSGTYTA